MRSTTWAIAACACIAAGAQAQRQIPVGARVKIVISEEQRQASTRLVRIQTIRGELIARSADSLWLRLSPFTGVVSVPKPAVRRIFESRGTPSRIGGMFIEGISGAIVGSLEFMLINTLFDDDRFGSSVSEAAVRGATFGGIFGGSLGLLLPVERWRVRSVDGQ